MRSKPKLEILRRFVLRPYLPGKGPVVTILVCECIHAARLLAENVGWAEDAAEVALEFREKHGDSLSGEFTARFGEYA
jgi:hypothetical protein